MTIIEFHGSQVFSWTQHFFFRLIFNFFLFHHLCIVGIRNIHNSDEKIPFLYKSTFLNIYFLFFLFFFHLQSLFTFIRWHYYIWYFLFLNLKVNKRIRIPVLKPTIANRFTCKNEVTNNKQWTIAITSTISLTHSLYEIRDHILQGYKWFYLLKNIFQWKDTEIGIVVMISLSIDTTCYAKCICSRQQ